MGPKGEMRNSSLSPQIQLKEIIVSQMENLDVESMKEVSREIPRKWEKFGDLILFGDTSFVSKSWDILLEDGIIYQSICKILHVSRIAKKGAIQNNNFRSPMVKLMYGTDPWVLHRDNNLRLTWNIEHSMFSAGNITEKIRMSKFNCQSEVIVDLYAGIGYFTLQLLAHAKAQYIHACEWNPYALEALRRNLKLNGLEERCRVYAGDNSEVCPKGIADRVILGLIPSSEPGWPVACRALKQETGGILHIHGNVTSAIIPKSPKDVSEASAEDGSTGPLDTYRNVTSNFVSSASAGSTDVITDLNSQLDRNCLSNSVKEEVKCDLAKAARNPDPAEISVVEKKSEFCEVSQDLCPVVNAVFFKHPEWREWALQAKQRIQNILQESGNCWVVDVLHIEHVKSYAPRIDHLVLDLKCTPDSLLEKKS